MALYGVEATQAADSLFEDKSATYRPEHNIASGRRLVVGHRVPRYNNGPSSISSLDGSAIANNACRIARPRGIWYVDMRNSDAGLDVPLQPYWRHITECDNETAQLDVASGGCIC